MKQAQTYDEIKPLIELCKAGKFFDAQAWISEGKPVDPPLPVEGKARKKGPLEVAIETGFHSLVEVLLDGGASVECPRYNPLLHALWKRRHDMVSLLVEHGADINSVDMEEVFHTWNNDIVEYFIEKGANAEWGDPLAAALCSRIRTALAIFMRYKDRFPSFQEQVNIALRHHCKEGNLKWVSLMLWAGADPYTKGPDRPGYEPDPEEDNSALELAAWFGHLDIFKLKAIRLDPNKEVFRDLMRNACHNDSADLLKMLLEKGFSPRDMDDKGSSLIRSLLLSMDWNFDPFSFTRQKKDIDTSRSREKIKMIHMLARNGARWEPSDRYDINEARRTFLKMIPDYVMEFIWIMSEYKSCTRAIIEDLTKTPAMRTHISRNINRYNELVKALNTM